MPCVEASGGQQRPMTPPENGPRVVVAPRWREDMRRPALALDATVAAIPTPTLDRCFGRVSAAADRSRIWVMMARMAVAVGDGPGRGAAADGVVSIGLTSAVVNLVLKPLGDRRRPNPVARRRRSPLRRGRAR